MQSIYGRNFIFTTGIVLQATTGKEYKEEMARTCWSMGLITNTP
jgi:hypothetical protein